MRRLKQAISAARKPRLGTRTLAALQAGLVLSCATLSPGCLTRKEVDAALWLNNLPLPKELCTAQPALRDRGIYRRLENGKLEFVSVCTPQIHDYMSAHKDDVKKVMDALLPESTGGQ